MDEDRLPAHAVPHQGRLPVSLARQHDTAYHSPLPPPSQDTTAAGTPESAPFTPSPRPYHHQHGHHDPASVTHTATSPPLKPSPPLAVPAEPERLPKARRKLSKKWQRRLYWMVPLAAVCIALLILFEVYREDFERWLQPVADWLKARDAWSWVIPTAILFLLSFPPLFGHEIVMLLVGLTYPIGVGIGIACAGAILGEAACFIVFKYWLTSYVDKKIEDNVKWAATARVSNEAGFRGVLIIRYSIVPPHLANPLFACTGMAFWLYMITVILSLPKTIIFVILGAPSAKGSTAAKWGKVVAIGILVLVTIFASLWIRKKAMVATAQIKAERAARDGDEMHEMLASPSHAALDDASTPLKRYSKMTTNHAISDIEAQGKAPQSALYSRLAPTASEVDLGTSTPDHLTTSPGHHGAPSAVSPYLIHHRLSPHARRTPSLGRSPPGMAAAHYSPPQHHTPNMVLTTPTPEHEHVPPYPTGHPSPSSASDAKYPESPPETAPFILSLDQTRPEPNHDDDHRHRHHGVVNRVPTTLQVARGPPRNEPSPRGSGFPGEAF